MFPRSCEVLRVHMQFVTVELTQFGKSTLQVVHVLDSITKGGQHLSAMALDLSISHDTLGRGQVTKSSLEVVQVLDGIPKRGQHLLAMGLNLGVSQDSRGRREVAKGIKEPLGPGVDNQQSVEKGKN
uniref:Uncharacterized protein n=1 Tax=Sarcophilus harrisii TaxID=9305 RepID=A0A7N4PVQ2_SARHA